MAGTDKRVVDGGGLPAHGTAGAGTRPRAGATRIVVPRHADWTRPALGSLTRRARGLPRRVLPVAHHPATTWIVLLAAALLPFTVNLLASPDTQYDEVVYTRASQMVATQGHLTWSTEPVFVHPPLYFLVQAAWLWVTGAAHDSIFGAMHAARILTASLGAADTVLLGGLTYLLTWRAPRRHRLILVAAVVAVAMTDPVLVRYSRLAVIDSLALFGCLVALLASWWARRTTASRHVLLVGLLTGLTLLVKEVSVFLLLSPVAFGVVQRDIRYVRRAGAAFGVGVATWLVFPLWAVQLGAPGRFAEVQFYTAERLVGLLQVTGLNQPGVSLSATLLRSASQYGTSYILLVTGGLALIWLLFERGDESGDFVLAILLCSYLFAAYMVGLGTLNEQFFVYILPASILGSVLGVDILIWEMRRRAGRLPPGRPRRRLRLGCWAVTGLSLLVPVGAAASWYTQYGGEPNDGIARMAAYIDGHFPSCSAVNASGDPEKYEYSLAGRPVSEFAGGAGALAAGVHLFFLSEKDVLAGYGEMTPELADWIRANGRLLASFHSLTYLGVQLWEVPDDRHDATADILTIPTGVFVNTVGSRCGGYRVENDGNEAFLTEYTALGGKAAVGAPISRRWTMGDTSYQAFDGVVLQSGPGRTAFTSSRPRPIAAVARLARQAPQTYRKYAFPPVSYSPSSDGRTVLPRLNDPVIAKAYLGVSPAGADRKDVANALQRWGAPLGPARPMSDGAVRQAFERAVVERPASTPDVARLAPLGRALAEGLGVVPAAARQPESPPPLSVPSPPPLPSAILPFVVSLAVVLLGYLLAWWTLVRRAERRSPPATEPDHPSDLTSEPVS